ncbi:endonuclease/exonuclease/phosphatase [Sphingomonas sp. Leaf231]|uniref:endonuclease/exonuclease/phosphatase n=1 Tax=Sphingomonas sp. Leaf231 TaxID=1736301 RepID=UPI000700A871|nr:endonuclease/exonuclease/phosphatase [Sphingomonas sp. Leaf231]KQN89801.1 endonuclease/exonuclease/phosphatase [Sphingomonas sp. Leaf231]
MSTQYWNLGAGDLVQDWSDASLISQDDDWSRVPGIMGFRGDDLTTRTGTDPRDLAGSSDVVDVIANQTSTAITNGGIAEFQIANPVVALQGSGTADAPYLAFYLDARARSDVRFTATVRDIDGGADNAVQQVAVQYRLSDTAAWIDLPSAYIADATTAGTATQESRIDVTLPDAANGVATLQVRVITTNAVGSDEWVGIDDIRVTSSGAGAPQPGVLSIADATTTEGDAGTHDIAFTVSRVGGSSGAVEAGWSVTLPGGVDGADAGDFAAGTAFAGTVAFADGQTSATIRLAVAGDMLAERNETFAVTLSNASGGATVDRAVATGTIRNDDIAQLSIGEIQGSAARSAYEGQTVHTGGIVTAIDSNGFYIQDDGDGDAATSDGIFVFTSAAPQNVFLGDTLSIEGRVSEFRAGTGGLTVTQLNPTSITVETTGDDLPEATLVGPGGLTPPTQAITDGIAFWEALEGMRVTLDTPHVVSNTTADQWRETDVVVAGGEGASGVNARGGITISPGDYNPEKIQIQRDAAVFDGFEPAYSIGDRLSGVTGVVNYANATYEVIVTEAVSVTKDVTLAKEVTALKGDATHLSIATYNVENLDSSDGKFDVLAGNIVYNLQAPDIVALQEIQDADGAGNGSDLSGQATAQGLIDAIAAIDGGRYGYVEVAPTSAGTTGGEPGGNIRNGYLYNLDRVDYVAGSATLIAGDAYANSRKPLAATFDFNGEQVTTINVHFTSRGGSDPLWGVTPPPFDAGDTSRTAQAAGVKAWVNDRLAADPLLNVAIMGDWNGFYFEQAQTQLTDPAQGGKFTNLNSLLPEEERYSYMFQGNAQALDNMLVTGGLLDGASFDAVHLNAEFGGDRPTDHDPQLALLKLGFGAEAAHAASFDPWDGAGDVHAMGSGSYRYEAIGMMHIV